ncbi:MAG: TlpA disulfide reductase family protein [Flavobacteriales bacterium]
MRSIIIVKQLLPGLFASLGSVANAQTLTGEFTFREPPEQVVLWSTTGADHDRIDSTPVRGSGHFDFAEREYPAGFYQLSINDSDRVDIILDPRERVVELQFHGKPLQEHVSVIASLENQRMWKYKLVSRNAQAELQVNREKRGGAAATDIHALMRLDSADQMIRARQEQDLERLIDEDTTSYFGHVVRGDRRLMAAIPNGFQAIKEAFDWTDGRMLRSSIRSKAIMAVLQSVPMDWENGLARAADSLLFWSREREECWSHTRDVLVELFAVYGPDHVAQYLVDTYVVGAGALVPANARLRSVAADLIRVTVGARAPEILLPTSTGDTVHVTDMLGRNTFTCLFFYSSTCDHCHAQLPGLRVLYDELHERGFELVGIALDADTAEFNAMIAEEHIMWPSYTEAIGWGSKAAKAYAVKSTPSFFLLSREGSIVAKPQDHEELRSFLEKALE